MRCSLAGVVVASAAVRLFAVSGPDGGEWQDQTRRSLGREASRAAFFTGKGLRACVWEAEKWDGPYNKLVGGPVKFDSTGCQIMDFGGAKYVMTANLQQRRPVYSYPSLAYVGEWRADFYPYNNECQNGRIFTAFARTPPGSPYKYIMLTMDRQNFPGMPLPNWTYGGLYFYGANP